MIDDIINAEDATREHLAELEAELEEYPDQRGDILLEIAGAHIDLGESDRAVAIWRGLIDEDSDDGDYARVQLAEHLFDQGQNEAARAELATLKATRRTDGGGWQLAADLLKERGDLPEALVWYTMATERFTPDEVTQLGGDLGWTTEPGMLVRRRRTIRTAMGLPPDETDRRVLSEDRIHHWRRQAFPTTDQAAETVRAVGAARAEVRVLFWPRAEFDAARAHWPDELRQDGSSADYFRDLEAQLAAVAVEGAQRISVVHCSVESFIGYLERNGGTVLDPATRRQYLDVRHREGHHLAWPPQRNQPCWCGSQTKYKKCCGAPTG